MHASARPLVSVCIPAYNDSAVVADALRSAMRQDYAPLEILVVDNNSTDGTWEVATATASGDSRVRVLRNSENIGMARNFSTCVASAHGECVLILCADDVLGSGCIELLATTLCEHPKAVLAACGRTFTDAKLRPLRVIRARTHKEEVEARILLRECFAHGNRIGEPSAVMFRRNAAVRGFDPAYSQSVDLEMWFHLLEKGSAVMLPESRCLVRQHGAQMTRTNLQSGRIVKDKQLLFGQYAARIGPTLTPMDRLAWDLRMASSLARTRAAGGNFNAGSIVELFYPNLFSWLLYPAIRLAWKFHNILFAQRL